MKKPSIVISHEAEPKSKNKKAVLPEAEAFNPLADIDKTIDKIERAYALTGSSMAPGEKRQSTGLLCLNLILAGGIVPAWYTTFGPEQSCKSTLTMWILCHCLDSGIPIKAMFDYEGSTTPDYIENMLKTIGVDRPITDVFGIKNPKTDKWEVKPEIRYYSENIGEKFFDWLAQLERKLPDKKLMGEKWYYIYNNTTENKAIVGNNYDVAYYKKNKLFRVPAPDGKLQALVLLDSYPAMLPEKQDVDDPNSAIAVQARMFSDQLKRVKGKMKAKRIAVLGVNQLRKAPMSFGNPEIEPCGEALKFFCFSGDTLIQTSKGLLYASEISSEKKLPSVVGEAGLETPEMFGSMGISKIVEATTDFGFQIRGKPSHRVRAIAKGSIDLTWVELKNLKRNHVYYVPVKVGSNVFPQSYVKLKYLPVQGETFNNVIHKIPRSYNVDEDLASIVGYLVSEGYVRNGMVVFTNHNKLLLKKFAKLVKKVFRLSIKRYKTKCEIYSVELCEFLVSIGAGGELSRFKEVPMCIRKSPKSVQVAFLKALFDGDGYITEREAEYNSISNKLLDQVHLMLLNLGIFSKKKPYSIRYTDHHLEVASDLNMQKMEAVLSMEAGARFKELFNFGHLYISGTNKYLLDSLFAGVDPYTYLSKNSMYDVLPDFYGWRNGMSEKLKTWLDQLNKGSKYFRLADFYPGWEEDACNWAESLRTTHERKKNVESIRKISDFINYTRENSLIWVKVEDVKVLKEQATYDFNMPETHTVVTNGVVSHNSDVRLRSMPRALSGVPIKGFGTKGMLQEEPSVTGSGTDQYRFINIRATKNKLSVPNLDTWVRLWIQDSNGEARGFDPVWDCFYYLHQTGQAEGDGKKITLKVKGIAESKKTLTWMQFKILIIGSLKQRKEVFEKLGVKPFNLKSLCNKQVDEGEGLDFYLKTKSAPVVKKSRKGDAEEGDDDD